MENSTSKGNPPNLDVPHPTIEFPFPRSPTESYQNGPLDPTNRTSLDGDAQSPGAVAPSEAMKSQSSASIQRPTLPQKSLTERPEPAPPLSRLHLRRGHTGQAPAALNNDVWPADSDTNSSSSDDEMAAAPKRKENFTNAQKRKANPRRHKQGSGEFSRFSVSNDNFKTRGKVSKTSGRLNISVNETAHRGYLVKALGATLQQHLKTPPEPEKVDPTPPNPRKVAPSRPDLSTRLTTLVAVPTRDQSIPKLNIVIMVIGSRGDIQPFLKLGKLLKEENGHRIRIATHPAFKDFVEQDSGLEFFSVGGDPAELMAFMVKNPGLIPSVSTVKAGEIGKKRDSMFEMFQGFWRACINATDNENNVSNLKMMGDKHPFVADAIIANPPSFAHIHCAERLGIPLHLMFTFPYSPTQQFPHPLANIKKSNVDTNYANFISYPLVEMM